MKISLKKVLMASVILMGQASNAAASTVPLKEDASSEITPPPQRFIIPAEVEDARAVVTPEQAYVKASQECMLVLKKQIDLQAEVKAAAEKRNLVQQEQIALNHRVKAASEELIAANEELIAAMKELIAAQAEYTIILQKEPAAVTERVAVLNKLKTEEAVKKVKEARIQAAKEALAAVTTEAAAVQDRLKAADDSVEAILEKDLALKKEEEAARARIATLKEMRVIKRF